MVNNNKKGDNNSWLWWLIGLLGIGGLAFTTLKMKNENNNSSQQLPLPKKPGCGCNKDKNLF